MSGRPKGEGQVTRMKAITIAGQLFSEKGYEGVGLQEIVQKGGIPKGSLYFHFPDGKEQLALEAMTAAAENYRNLVLRAVEDARRQGGDLSDLIHAAFSALRNNVASHDFKSACPIAPLAMVNPPEAIRKRANHLYEQWVSDIQGMFRGFPISRADCTAILASIEGSLLLARTYQSLAPLDCAEELLSRTLAASSRD